MLVKDDPENTPTNRPHEHNDLLPTSEHERVLRVWNATQADYPHTRCLHQLFEAQVEQTPHAVALIAGNRHLTFDEVNRHANRLAHYLRSTGVGNETLVGICMERSPALIIGLFAILKAGAAYVPLDPTYPTERLALMLRDTGVPLVLTQQKVQGLLPEHNGQSFCLERDWAAVAPHSDQNPAFDSHPDMLACVHYTSGSTGTPKGVLGSHRASVNRMAWLWRTYPFAAGEVCCHRTPLVFVDSMLEVFGALLQGVPLLLIPESSARDPRHLHALLHQYRVTRLVLVPSLLAALLDTPPDARPDTARLKYWFVSGEELTVELLSRFREQVPGGILVNLYGTSEILDATWYDTRHDHEAMQRVPIGKPISNMHAYILNEQMQPVAVGATGDLYVGGVGLARGYLNRPDLTSERFLPDPFSQQPGARLYKTGDLARYLEDGTIEFLGRSDSQVKVRGFRVELGEIETVLRQHPSVREAAVVARDDMGEDTRLVAYLVPDQPVTFANTCSSDREGEQVINAVRYALRKKLPDYMVPSAFVLLERLPLTPNGKLDRRALPRPQTQRPTLESAYAAPRNRTEQQVAEVWAAVLGLAQVGIHDDFFALGGHSLQAMRIISRLRTLLQAELPLRSMLENATVASVAAAIATMHSEAPEQRHQPPPSIPRQAKRGAPLPLSFAQQRLWFLEQLGTARTAYILATALRLSGHLDRAALEQSINDIVARHEALRTTFLMQDGEPVQIIAPRLQIGLHTEDLRHLPAAERAHAAQRSLYEEAQEPFHLSHGPMLRTTLLQLDDEQHILLLTIHHIVIDEWSFGQFFRELAALYTLHTSKTAGIVRSALLHVLPIQYADFTRWQHEWLQGTVLAQQLAYWRAQLADMPPLLPLPTDYPRPAVQRMQGATLRRTLPQPLIAALRALAQQEGATLFMTMLSAFATLLMRYTSQHDLPIGSPVANRTHSELEDLIGFFVNMLVLRINTAGNPTFREVLGRVREVALGAYAHQDIPFEYLVNELQPERTLSYQPLFQVMFAENDITLDPRSFPGLQAERMEVENGTARFDLTLTLETNGSEITGAWEYATDLFEHRTIERMATHFEHLLQGIAANADAPIATLPLLTATEQQQILVAWNATRMEYPRHLCLHQLFEAQAARTPDAIALVSEQGEMTYGELDRRANAVAHQVQALGVAPDTLVGIYVERSSTMLIGLLGILKAGGAYVPLDPTYPHERLTSMLEDAHVGLLLTQERLITQLPPLPAHTTHVLSIDAPVRRKQPTEVAAPPERDTTPNHRAYVIYTSGSTGKPKGVQIPHRAVVNFLCAMQQQPGIGAGDVLLAVTTLSFDIAVLELFLPLVSGARLVLASREVAADGERLAQLMHASGTTMLQATPATWRLLLEAGWQGSPHLTMLCGGEAFPWELAQQLLARGQTLWNMYGPTETTIWSAVRQITPEDGAVWLGGPIGNTQLYVLDAAQQPLPVGVPGELSIGGDGLAHGYLNRPQLTAEKFVTVAPGSLPPARLYRTGDQVRYLPDGRLEFLGRIDNQVKLRGFRIELGELEALLRQHEAVQQAVVVVREERTGDPRLVAYLIARQHEADTPANGSDAADLTDVLRRFLQRQVPDYMVPSAFVWLAQFPLTLNGKIDRRALPAPEAGTPATGSVVAPRTPVEEMVRTIWAEVLGVETTGVHENFFALGGHSLLATRLVARLQTAFQVKLPLRRLFEQPTIAELAAALIEFEKTPGQVEKIARLRQRIKDMSSDEIQAMLREKQHG